MCSPPALEQFAARARQRRLHDLQRGDAVEAEMAEVAAQFAPRGDDARALSASISSSPNISGGRKNPARST